MAYWRLGDVGHPGPRCDCRKRTGMVAHHPRFRVTITTLTKLEVPSWPRDPKRTGLNLNDSLAPDRSHHGLYLAPTAPSRRPSTPASLDIAIQPPANPNGETNSSDISPRRRVQLVVERTVDRLGRSLSGRNSLKKPSPSTPTHRRPLSIGRTARSKRLSDAADGDIFDRKRCCFLITSITADVDACSESSTRTPTPSTSSRSSASLTPAHNDELPFIQPPSPSFPSSRPSLQSFRAWVRCVFSFCFSNLITSADSCVIPCRRNQMHAGTQTLIQVLQAIGLTQPESCLPTPTTQACTALCRCEQLC